MTDAPETPAVPAEATAETSKARRGRPRPAATIERDGKVLDRITAGGITKADLTNSFNGEMTANEVYLSLYRLRKDGKIVRNRAGGTHTWQRVGEPAAVPA